MFGKIDKYGQKHPAHRCPYNEVETKVQIKTDKSKLHAPKKQRLYSPAQILILYNYIKHRYPFKILLGHEDIRRPGQLLSTSCQTLQTWFITND